MEKKPAIRFEGYSDEWKKGRLSEYLDVSTQKNTEGNYSKKDVLSVSGDYGIINQIEFHGKSLAGASVLNYGVVQNGDVVYTKSPLNANPYGIIKTNKGKSGIVSTLYAVYRPKEGVFPDFIQVYFEESSRMNNYVLPLVSKGAKNDMKISAENALKGTVVFPAYGEQVEICIFFDHINALIDIHQCNLDRMIATKKSMLDKLFPQGDAKVPAIRFEGFKDEWEKKPLGELFEEYSEKGHEELPPLMIIQGAGTIPRNESDRKLMYNKANLSGYKLVRKGDFIVHLRSFEGGLEIATTTGIISPAYHTLHGENVDSDFYYAYFRSRKFIDVDLRHHVYGIRDGRSIDINGMKTILIPYTSYEEQKQIAGYLNSLDELIGLYRFRVEKLKNIKAACLQRMFV